MKLIRTGIEFSLEAISGRDYRNYGRPATLVVNEQIPNQYLNAKMEDPEIKTVVMTGGGNDILTSSYTDLSGADLSGADLRGAVLRNARLTGCSLRRANLGRDRVNGATKLESADLSQADLEGAVLEGAQYDAATRLSPGVEEAGESLLVARGALGAARERALSFLREVSWFGVSSR